MCYQTENNHWICCYCKKYANEIADRTCKGCGHDRCATFGEDDSNLTKPWGRIAIPLGFVENNENDLTAIDARSAHPANIEKLRASSMYGRVDPSRKLLDLLSQHEQAKATVNLLLRTPIQDRDFLIGIRSLERILAMAQNPEASGDNSITKDAWEKLSAFLKICRTIVEHGYHVDELLRHTLRTR